MSFNSKKTATLSVVAAALLATCWGAQAAGNTANIVISAEVTDSTCALTQPKSTIELGNISSKTLAKAVGSTSAESEIKLELTDCGSKVASATVKVEGKEDGSKDNFANTDTSAAGAKGVAVEITGGESPAKIKPNGDAKYGIKTGSNTLNFKAKLVSTEKTVTAGKVTSPITFTVSYK